MLQVHGALRPRLPELLAVYAYAAERSARYTEEGGARCVLSAVVASPCYDSHGGLTS